MSSTLPIGCSTPISAAAQVFDLGVYVISFAQQFLGTPEQVHAVGGLLPNGVEGDAGILLGYAGRTLRQPVDRLPGTGPGPPGGRRHPRRGGGQAAVPSW